MAVALTASAVTAQAVSLATLIEAGAANSTLVMLEGATTVFSFDLGADPFPTPTASTLTLSGVPLINTAVASTTTGLSGWEIRDGDGNALLTGTVGVGTGDISLGKLNWAVGETMTLESLTITQQST